MLITAPELRKEAIILRTPDEVEKIRRSSSIVAEVLRVLRAAVAPGMNTMALERIAEEELKGKDAIAAFKGYMGYPYSLCVSINEEVIHGMPSEKKFIKEGDIVGIDFGVFHDGFYGDAAITVGAGEISEEARRLIDVTEQCLNRAIDAAVAGNRLYDISHAIEGCAECAGYSVVKAFSGHGIGSHLHEPPQVPNFGRAGTGVRLKEGMVLAIEPMVNAGKSAVRVLSDGWTAVTADGTLSAHFEHTVAITERGPSVLTSI